MNRIGPVITSTKLTDIIVPDEVARVLADSGTFVDQGGASNVWLRVGPFDPSLVNFCRAGKVSTLYSLVP